MPFLFSDREPTRFVAVIENVRQIAHRSLRTSCERSYYSNYDLEYCSAPWALAHRTEVDVALHGETDVSVNKGQAQRSSLRHSPA